MFTKPFAVMGTHKTFYITPSGRYFLLGSWSLFFRSLYYYNSKFWVRSLYYLECDISKGKGSRKRVTCFLTITDKYIRFGNPHLNIIFFYLKTFLFICSFLFLLTNIINCTYQKQFYFDDHQLFYYNFKCF